jgi:hypothetical protein
MARPKILDNAWVNCATVGTGTLTLGTALPGASTFANGGAVNADVIAYWIRDANGAWERGFGTYTAVGTTLTRNLLASSTGSLISLSGVSTVYSEAMGTDLWPKPITITPVWTSTGTAVALGNGTISGRVCEHGRYQDVTIYQTMGSTTTYGSGTYAWSLPSPYNGAAEFYAVGVAIAFDAGVAIHTGSTYINTGGTTIFAVTEGAVDIWQPTKPHTWNSGDSLMISIRYAV